MCLKSRVSEPRGPLTETTREAISTSTIIDGGREERWQYGEDKNQVDIDYDTIIYACSAAYLLQGYR